MMGELTNNEGKPSKFYIVKVILLKQAVFFFSHEEVIDASSTLEPSATKVKLNLEALTRFCLIMYSKHMLLLNFLLNHNLVNVKDWLCWFYHDDLWFHFFLKTISPWLPPSHFSPRPDLLVDAQHLSVQ